MTITRIVTVNKKAYTFIELNSRESEILAPFLDCSISAQVELENTFEEVILPFLTNKLSIAHLREHSHFIFSREFEIKNLYNMGSKINCKYTSFDLNQVGFYTELSKTAIQKSAPQFVDILEKRGLERFIANQFVNGMLHVDLSVDCLKNLTSRLQNVDISSIRNIYRKTLIKDGESPIRILNGISERQQQKNLNLKRVKTDVQTDSSDGVTLYQSVRGLNCNEIYVHVDGFNFFYIIENENVFYQILGNSKQYIIAFYRCSQSSCFFILTNDKKLENSSKKKLQLQGYSTDQLHIPFAYSKLATFDVSGREPKYDTWYLPVNFSHIHDLHKTSLKTVTMNVKPKYYEIRMLCDEDTINALINNEFYKLILLYKVQPYYDVSQQNEVNIYNVSIFIYYLTFNDYVNTVVLPYFSQNPSKTLIETSSGRMPLGVLFTSNVSSLTNQELNYDNALRLMYLKLSNSLHPYPTSLENAELLNSLKVKIAMSEITGSKIEGSKHLHDGAMSAILSERGLYVVSEKETHNKWRNHQDSRSSIFFNEPYLQNYQNESLTVKLTQN